MQIRWYYIPKTQDVYVHLNSRNIGKGYPRKNRDKETGLSPNSIYETFKEQREQTQKAVMNQAKRQFKANIMSPLNSDQLDLIDKAFDSNTPSDFLNELDEAIKTLFEERVNKALIESVMMQEKEMTNTIKYENLVAKSAQKAITELDKLLDIIAKTADLFGKEGKALASCLLIANQYSTSRVNDKINHVKQAMDDFIKTHNGDSLDIKGAKNVALQLNKSLTKIAELRNGDKKVKDVRKSIVTSLENNLFSTYFGEWAGAKIKRTANGAVNNFISTQVVGDKEVTMTYYDEEGNISDYNAGRKGRTAQQKTDFILNTKYFSLKISEEPMEVKMSIGVSNKFYKVKDLKKGGRLTKTTYELGGGGTLNQAINALSGNNVRMKYLCYNLIQHPTKRLGQSINEFRRNLIGRQILTFMASRNKEDFAQLFLLNGEVVSLYEILNKVFSDMDKIENIITTSPKITGLSDKPEYNEKSRYEGGKIRYKNVHDYAKNTSLKAVLHYKNLIELRA